MGLSAIFIQSLRELGIVLALASAIIFFWDIFGQTKSAIAVEDRISKLEDEVEQLKRNDNTKSDNQ